MPSSIIQAPKAPLPLCLQENRQDGSFWTVPRVPLISRKLPCDQGGCEVRHYPSNGLSFQSAAVAAMDLNVPILLPLCSSSFGQGYDVRLTQKRARDDAYDPDTPHELFSEPPKERRGPKSISRFRGVCITKTGKWRAIIYTKRKQKYLGIFNSEEDAAKAYDRGAIEIFGESAELNFCQIKP